MKKSTCYLLIPRQLPELLSLVIPLFNEEEVFPLLIERLRGLAKLIPCPVEFVLVNDGSSDRTIHLLYELAREDQSFKVISLARNFGHQVAATAGLDAASGEAIALMDADLQDPPELVVDMLAEYQKGYDVVYAQRAKREGETVFKKLSAWLFYRFMRLFVYKDLPTDVGDYRLVSRRFLDALNSMRETHRFLRGMVSWVGFSQTYVRFVRPPRAAGETKYPLHKMLKFAWTAAVSFSPAPLRLSFLFGFGLLGTGIVYAVYSGIRILLGHYVVPGWTSVIVLILVSAGAIMSSIGVLGEYVARIFEESKGRPLYIVNERFNLPK